MGLGATRIEASYDETRLARFGVEGRIAVGAREPLVTCDGSRVSEHSGHMTIEMPASKRAVAVPHDLLWLPREESWKTMAEARLKHGATAFDLRVGVSESAGINVQLAAEFDKIGLRVGGSF